MSKSVLFQTIQFNISTQFSSILPYQVLPRGASHSPKLQHYRNFTIRLFSVLSRTLVAEVLPLCRWAVGVFYSSSQLGEHKAWSSSQDLVICFYLKLLLLLLLFGEFFTPALADDFSLEFEWRQFSSSLLDSSQYFDRS